GMRSLWAPSLRRIFALAAVSAVTLTSCGGSTTTTSAGSPTIGPTATSPVGVPTSASPTPATWERMAASHWKGDYQPPTQSVGDGTRMLMAAPQATPPDCKEFVLAYDPATDAWRTLSQVPKQKGCFEGVDEAVWTGEELLLWASRTPPTTHPRTGGGT